MLTGARARRLVTTQVNVELVITGVEFSHKHGGEEVFTAKASKEVILSAGYVVKPRPFFLHDIKSQSSYDASTFGALGDRAT